ncbi:hypothetical protein ABW19_dt0210203 [Dactylella cylindrospora]|nr:hypothetical protein ABW19_dt0210203 [Dactylella cylindrospora]
MSQDPKEHRIVVGIDYGTTHSGCAFGNTSQKSIDHINVITRWPGRRQNMAKTPSDIAYGNGSFIWGFEIPDGQPRLAWAKLDLEEEDVYASDFQDEEPSPEGPSAEDLYRAEIMRHNPLNKSPVDVVSDYLTVFCSEIMSQLMGMHGEKYIQNTGIDWVMTVPAVWSDKAQALTKEAAARAGIGQRSMDTLRLLSEPEAAAVYVISEVYQRNNARGNAGPDSLQVGDHFVICDGGGGTVDLIAYRINQLQPCLSISEVAVGSGGKYGSTFVNRNFLEMLHYKLGPARFKRLKEMRNGTVMGKIVSELESAKRQFGRSGFTGGVYSLPAFGLPDDPAAGIIDGMIELSNDDVRDCFDPIVDEILELVQGQIDAVCDTGATVKYVFLVGGFGESQYLLGRLQDHNFERAGQIEIINPVDAWSAVSRGAVLRGLDGSLVPDRRCRRNYGTRINTVFDPMIHHEEDAFYSTDTGIKMARNQVSWIVEKGTVTSADIRFQLKCGTTFQKGEKLRRGATLVASDLDVAPHSYRDKSVHDLCFLMADLSMVEESEFDEVNLNGQTYLAAEFTIEIAFGSAEIKFELYYKGRCYGQVKTTFH